MMTRRSLLLAIPALVVSADLEGTDRKRRADAKCSRIAGILSRRGLTQRERDMLARLNCQEVNGEWRSSQFFTM